MTFHEMYRQFDKGQAFRVDAAHLEVLLDKLHQYLFVKNRDGRFIYCNSNFAALLGASKEQIIGKTDSSFFPTELVKMFRETDNRVLADGADYDGEETIPFPVGGTKTVLVNKTPLCELTNGSRVGIVGIFVDLTHYREHFRDQQTRNLNAKTNDLVHEVLIPMQAIASNLQNLISGEEAKFVLTHNERLTALRFALSQLHVLWLHAENTQKHLIGDAEKQYVFRESGVRGVLLECIEALEYTADEKHIDLQHPRLVDLKEFPRLEMSRIDLVRAFKNIYHNAVKYSYYGTGRAVSSSHPKRWISTTVGRESDTHFYVEIQNYGIGITPDELPFVFDEGFRGKFSIDRSRTGSGIGLSQVKKIVTRHSGVVSLTCEKVGGPYRTTVRVVIPYIQGPGVLRYDQDLETALG